MFCSYWLAFLAEMMRMISIPGAVRSTKNDQEEGRARQSFRWSASAARLIGNILAGDDKGVRENLRSSFKRNPVGAQVALRFSRIPREDRFHVYTLLYIQCCARISPRSDWGIAVAA